MNTIQSRRAIAGSVCATIAILVAGMPAPASAQRADAARSAELLKKTIQIDAAPRTLEEITRILSIGTGLTIEAESSLLERTVVIQSNHTSAADILDALAELHDWRLEETEDHKIRIRLPIVKPATSLQEVPLSIKTALPKDLRNFLGLGLPTDSLPPPAQQKALEARRAVSPTAVANEALKFRIDEKANHVKQALLDMIPLDMRRGRQIRWVNLEKPLQTALLLGLVVDGLQDAFRSGGGEAILAQRLHPFQADPSRLEISARKQQGDTMELLIGSTTYTGERRLFEGFSGTVSP